MHEKTTFARHLRQRMTAPELVLWQAIRRKALNAKFRRQAPLGVYIVDFVCLDKRLIIEVDGDTHVDEVYDQRRDAWFLSQGFTTRRFSNREVMTNLAGVIEAIAEELERLPARRRECPSLILPGKRGGNQAGGDAEEEVPI